MKRAMILLVCLISMSLSASLCDTPSSGSDNTKNRTQTWDIMLMGQTFPLCDQSFISSGAGSDTLPLGLFPGVSVLYNGAEYDADVPEVQDLAYLVTEAGLVNPGDLVRVRFTYQANADAQNGDFFLVRINDGDVFRTPAEVRGLFMAFNTPINVDYAYTAANKGFDIQFIAGLSQPGDVVYLDNLVITVNGSPLITDNFEDGDYENAWPEAEKPISTYPPWVRLPLRPGIPQGTFGLQAAVVLGGTQSFAFGGGSYFQLYGQGASMDGFSGAILTYTNPNYEDPFFGQTQAVDIGGLMQGDYSAFDDAVVPTCTEDGMALISVNPTGNADISGVWYLTIDAQCADNTLAHVEVGTPFPPHAMGDDLSVGRMLGFFMGHEFTMNIYYNMGSFGITSGNKGMMVLAPTYTETNAVIQAAAPPQIILFGAYDKSSSVFAGQVMGVIPTSTGTCEVTQGQFVALIDKSVFVPPPLDDILPDPAP